MYRYDDYYGYWTSDSDSEGGDDTYTRPNLGEGGKDTDFAPDIPPPPPNPEPEPPTPPITQTFVNISPVIMTLNETDEFNASAAGYIPAGQFTETRAHPLSFVKAVKGDTQQMVTVRNERTNYNYSALTVDGNKRGELFRFPYYVPPGADLSTLQWPTITYELYTVNNSASTLPTNNFYLAARDKQGTASGGYASRNVGSVAPGATKHLGPFTYTLASAAGYRQFDDFIPGQFNEFKFFMGYDNASWLTPGGQVQTQWMITNINTSLPTGYEFEFKKQQNWRSYFGINVVKDTNRFSIGTPTSTASFAVTPHPIGNGWTLTSNWQWDEYNTAQGYKHWEIPVTKLSGNYLFGLTPIVFPENDDFCSMEPTYKTPGPKAPWNLVSRHETFNYAQHWMRISDYAQYIGSTAGSAVFYCPRNWRGLVWLKQGTANNDII